ncbi:MAG: hypothetical protein ACREBS_05480 [Nitrososphaerales archaeon]
MASQFAPAEVRSIIIAWVVLSVAISISYIAGFIRSGSGVYEIMAAFIATATAFVFHEMGHKFVAIRRGYVAHFQMWTWGIALTLITAVAFQGRFLFGAPGAVYIAPAALGGAYGYHASNYRVQDHENMIISAAGPGMNLAFALFFLSLFLFSTFGSFVYWAGLFGFELNVGLGSFNMLPIPPLDGFKIFKNNIGAALAIALPLWAMFVYFFLL